MPDGRAVSFTDIALDSLHHNNQEQIMAVASYMSPVSPPPFAAQFAEVTVDTKTGQLRVDQPANGCGLRDHHQSLDRLRPDRGGYVPGAWLCGMRRNDLR